MIRGDGQCSLTVRCLHHVMNWFASIELFCLFASVPTVKWTKVSKRQSDIINGWCSKRLWELDSLSSRSEFHFGSLAPCLQVVVAVVVVVAVAVAVGGGGGGNTLNYRGLRVFSQCICLWYCLCRVLVRLPVTSIARWSLPACIAILSFSSLSIRHWFCLQSALTSRSTSGNSSARFVLTLTFSRYCVVPMISCFVWRVSCSFFLLS